MDIESLKKEYNDLQKKLFDPELILDLSQGGGSLYGQAHQALAALGGQKYKEIAARKSKLEKIINAYNAKGKLFKEIQELREIALAEDKEMAKMAEEDILQKEIEFNKISAYFEKLVKGGEEDNEINKIILEIRAGAGGLEASLFAEELFNMYKHYAEKNGLKVNIIDANKTDLGGYKEVVFEIEGEDVYKKLKNESGVHRVQRIPDTEKNGRIHTSTISVAVLPEAKDVDIEVKPEDVKIEFYRSSGPGGQNVNKVETAVRLIHLPTGVIVNCQEGRSQQKNREKAMTVLKARLLDAKRQEEEKKMSTERKKQIGTADRSEKIRTYNFPQDRITDHRINKSWHNITSILEGNMDDIIGAFE